MSTSRSYLRVFAWVNIAASPFVTIHYLNTDWAALTFGLSKQTRHRSLRRTLSRYDL